MNAYYDASRGVCAVKVIKIERGDHGFKITARVTATKHPTYRRGEEIVSSGTMIFPRTALIRRRYSQRIGAYSWDGVTV